MKMGEVRIKTNFLLIGVFLSALSAHSFAANVTSWSQGAEQSYASQLMGRWVLNAIFENGLDSSDAESQINYWIFKRKGLMDIREMPNGLQRGYYSLSNRDLAIKDKKTRSTRHFTIKYIDQSRLILIHNIGARTLTYNLERY